MSDEESDDVVCYRNEKYCEDDGFVVNEPEPDELTIDTRTEVNIANILPNNVRRTRRAPVLYTPETSKLIDDYSDDDYDSDDEDEGYEEEDDEDDDYVPPLDNSFINDTDADDDVDMVLY